MFSLDCTSDWKPMSTVGAGAGEIRIKDEAGIYRVIYVAKFEEAVYVLHVFEKKTQKTRKADIALAKARYKVQGTGRGKETEMTISEGYSNVFEALEDDPAMTQNLKIRSELMVSLRTYIEDEGLGQKKAAEVFGVHQPRISDLMRGKINKFTIDMLVNMLARIGKTVKLKAA
jgi:predicted XRE-type DNA-binding protein